MNEFIKALISTVDPKGGKGLGETIVLLALIIAVTMLAFYSKEIPPALTMLVSAVAGIIAGYKVGENKEQKKGGQDNVNDN